MNLKHVSSDYLKLGIHFRYINSDTAVPGEVGPQKDMAMSEAVPLVFGRDMGMVRDRDMSRDRGIDRVMSRGMDVDRGISLSHAISRSMPMPVQPNPSPPQPQLSVLPLRWVTS